MNYDSLLNAVAGVLNGGSMTIPAYLAFSSTVVTLDPTATTLSGEFGSRYTVSPSNVLNKTICIGIRSGSVASSSGNRINSLGLFSSSSGGYLYGVVLVPSVLHTSDYDFEVEWAESVTR